MEITGRLTADAVVRMVSEDTKVVGFTVAVNDSYKSGEERREIATYFECSYWRNAGVAEYLKKGDVVQVFGRVGVRAYVTKEAEAAAALTFRVSEIKLFGGSSPKEAGSSTAVGVAATGGDQTGGEVKNDDVPF
ncbi:single-stranded DNA-binding protein [Pedobacter frigiditerrae]|uniref:Single-stranded DNA-binding protein n=1 Tax=Pedobacter frigiditerrae TaxID=2530452 RepID=A0A4R0MR96_9SPHI|nr:single-stranded DNA-binding protein [Pedobacter frigiditerrae]TCC88554.1 single-stranded DNA-binding protein [Pedobacter frigiditerrae]